jgi:hypothetical protein
MNFKNFKMNFRKFLLLSIQNLFQNIILSLFIKKDIEELC